MFDPPPELHARFEAALAAIRPHLGAEHPMLIGGRDERAPRQFAVASPIDTRIVLGRFQAGEDLHARAAVAAAARGIPGVGARPVAGARARSCGARSNSSRRASTSSARCWRSRSARTGWRRSAKRRRRPTSSRTTATQMEANDGYVEADGGRPAAGLRQREPERAAALRPVARDRAVQLSVRAVGRPRGRGAGRRQHRRVQGGVDDAVERAPAGRCVPRRGRAARRVQLRDRAGRVHRRGADPASRRGGRHVHRQLTRSACT